MAKVPFTKLGLSKNTEIKNVSWNDQIIEVKQYLPVNDKLVFISNVINNSADENRFMNPVKIDACFALELLFNYTNINFTDKQKEDFAKLYDIVHSSGLLSEVIKHIPEDEYNDILIGTHRSIEEVYTYKNSIHGILQAVNQDYKTMDLDAKAIHSELADPENMAFLKDVLTKLG